MGFHQRLAKLGFSSYDRYLRSDLWQSFRKRYAKDRTTPKSCLACGNPRYQLHHVTYERLGEESFLDVMPLCETHHKEVHEWLDDRRMPLEKSHEVVGYLKTICQPYKKRSKKKKKNQEERPAKKTQPAARSTSQNRTATPKVFDQKMQNYWDRLWKELTDLRKWLPEGHEIAECAPWEFATFPAEKIKAMELAVRMTRDAIKEHNRQTEEAKRAAVEEKLRREALEAMDRRKRNDQLWEERLSKLPPEPSHTDQKRWREKVASFRRKKSGYPESSVGNRSHE